MKELIFANSLLLLEEGEPTVESDLLALALPHWNSLRAAALETVESHHKNFPLRRGIPREELKSRLKLSTRVFVSLINKLVRDGLLVEQSALLAKPNHTVTFDDGQQAKVQKLRRTYEQNPFSPPGLKESQAEVGADVLNALIDMDEFILVSGDILFRKQDYQEALNRIQQSLLEKETITLAEVRDLLNTSRKYAQALLEHLDAAGVTIRDGDFRRLKKK